MSCQYLIGIAACLILPVTENSVIGLSGKDVDVLGNPNTTEKQLCSFHMSAYA